MMRKTSRRSRRLMTGASVFTVLASMAASASAQQTSTSDSGLQEVVITGQRAALEAAQNRKENADQILDSISADDAGKLPDESVTEILQRVPGVSITHFESLGGNIDTNHYSAQGANVIIRGLSQVESLLNGQETFSAAGGRSISFEDIPPELLAGLDVYKSSNADQIEGGLGGTVNMRTKLPFDFKKETLTVTATGNYGDFSKEGNPGGSVLYANRWNSSAGEFGAMFDISYSDYSRRSDQIEVDPYYPQVQNGKQVLIPNDVDWGTNTTDVKRLGAYEALEWKPNNDLTFWQTGFRSDYWSTEYDDIAVSDGSAGTTVPVAGSSNTYNPNGVLTSSTGLYSPANGDSLPGQAGIIMAADAGKFWTHNQTTDLSQGVKWNVNDRLQVNSGFQYTYSQSQTYRQEIFTVANVPSFSVNTAGGGLPQISLADGGSLANANNYTWNNYMDHKEDHSATEFAWSADADYTISEDGFFRSAKAGLRVATHIETDDVSRYNWVGLTPDWDTPYAAVGASPSSYYTVNNFNNFFGGSIKTPGSLTFASKALLDGYPGNLTTLESQLSPAGTSLTQPVGYDGGSVSRQSTDSYDVYGMVRFGNDGDMLGIPFNGNFGLRVVRDSNSAAGGLGYGSSTVNIGGQTLTTVSSYLSNSGGRTFTMPLPSLNVQFLPTEDIHIRFAASQAMSNPSFANLNPSGYYGLTTNALQQITGASGSGLGNPNLKPELANQLDTSIEWYLPEGGQMHVAGFYKKIHDYITYGTETVTLPFQFTNGTSTTQNVAISQYMNTSKATIEGAEIGWQQFFKFLPDPFDGLGMDFNYTYISSNSPGDLAYDMYGRKISGLPVDNLSRDNINITGMYEKGPLSLRLAYTWRSKYLLTPNGITGTYTNAVTGASTTYSLPQYNDAYGQLDAGFGWRFDDNFSFQFQAVNLANSINKVLMGYGIEQTGHAWYMTDRRYQGSVTMSF